MFGLNVFFNVLTLIRKNYLCSKLNTYLVTIFLSEWGYYVYIEITLSVEILNSDVTYSNQNMKKDLKNQHHKYKIKKFIRGCQNQTISWAALVLHLCVFIPCDLTSRILTTVTRDSYQPIVTVIVTDSCFHARMYSKSLWFDWR